MNLTSRGFKKPLPTELYDIEVVNFNADLTDSLVGGLLDNKVKINSSAPVDTVLWIDTTVE